MSITAANCLSPLMRLARPRWSQGPEKRRAAGCRAALISKTAAY